MYIDIKGYEGRYQISEKGEVKSLLTDIILKQQLNNNGYLTVALLKNNKYKRHTIHKLVYTTYEGEVKGGFIIDHKDNDRLNNDRENLQQITQRENTSKVKKGSSNYVGVRSTESGKWRADIRVEGKKLYLGTFNTEIEAHVAYKMKLKTIKK